MGAQSVADGLKEIYKNLSERVTEEVQKLQSAHYEEEARQAIKAEVAAYEVKLIDEIVQLRDSKKAATKPTQSEAQKEVAEVASVTGAASAAEKAASAAEKAASAASAAEKAASAASVTELLAETVEEEG